MRTNLKLLGLSAALLTASVHLLAGQSREITFLAAVEGVAALPGSPSVVSAAGITRADERLLTIETQEHPIGRDPEGPRSPRRLVIVGGLDGTSESAEAVLAALRWFKERAPADLKSRWSVSVLPCAYPPACSPGPGATERTASGVRPPTTRALPAEAFPPVDGFFNHETSPEPRYVWRWVAFQAPDLVLEVRAGVTLHWEVADPAGTLLLDGARPRPGTLPGAISRGEPSGLRPVAAVRVETSVADAPLMLRSLLEAGASLGPSPLRRALRARAGRTPLEIARVLADRYPSTPSIAYIQGIAWSNTVRLATRLDDDALLAKVRSQLAPYLSGERPAAAEPYRLTNLAGHLALFDFAGPGQSREALELAIEGAELLLPETSGTIVRSPTGWTDDMFMATSVLSRVGGNTRDPRYGSAVGRLLTSYTEALRRDDGLFVHSERGPHAWGRGNGFALLGLTEALTYLPEDWADRARVLQIYRQHVATLTALQGADGMWRQVVDEPGSYRELTVTAMTVVAMARGVRLGWLDDGYRPVIDRAWRGVAAHVTEDGGVVDASTSTGAGETKRYYLDRTAESGFDERGGAMALWAAMEMDALNRP